MITVIEHQPRGWPLDRRVRPTVRSAARSCGEPPDGRGEHVAAVGVVAEHVEAGAGRRQQHGVARPRGGRARLAPPRPCRRHARVRADAARAPRRAPARRGRSARRAAPCRRRRRAAARNPGSCRRRRRSAPAGRACPHRGERRADVGALGVVDVAHAADRRRPTASGAAGRRTRTAPRASAAAAGRAPRPSASAASALAALCRPGRRIAAQRQQRLAAAHQPVIGARAALQRVVGVARLRRLKRHDAPGRRAASARTAGSSALTTATSQRVEDPRLGGGVVRQVGVAVHVVGRDVQHAWPPPCAASAWSRAGSSTAPARTGPGAGLLEQVERRRRRGCRRPRTGDRRRAASSADQRGHGALAVGAGDGQRPAPRASRANSSMSPTTGRPRSRAARTSGSCSDTPGRDHDLRHAVEQRRRRSRRCAARPPARCCRSSSPARRRRRGVSATRTCEPLAREVAAQPTAPVRPEPEHQRAGAGGERYDGGDVALIAASASPGRPARGSR